MDYIKFDLSQITNIQKALIIEALPFEELSLDLSNNNFEYFIFLDSLYPG